MGYKPQGATTIENTLIYKGNIDANSDFPTLASVSNGWTYFITTNVTDNDVSKTNTGQSFLSGSEIAWNGTNWTELGTGAVVSVNGATGVVLVSKLTDGVNEATVSDVKKEVEAEGCIDVIIGNGVNVISTGVQLAVEVPYAMTLTTARIFAIDSLTGDIVVDIWKDTYANFPPTDADTITGGEEPTISSGDKAEDTSLTSWTKTLAKGDIVYFNVDSITTLTKVLVSLKGTRT